MTTMLAATHLAAQADPITLALIGLAALTLWALSVLGRPLRTCRTCRGARVTQAAVTRRARPCRRCRATGITRRPGATTIHRLYWTIRAEHDRARDPHHPSHDYDHPQPSEPGNPGRPTP